MTILSFSNTAQRHIAQQISYSAQGVLDNSIWRWSWPAVLQSSVHKWA